MNMAPTTRLKKESKALEVLTRAEVWPIWDFYLDFKKNPRNLSKDESEMISLVRDVVQYGEISNIRVRRIQYFLNNQRETQ